MTYDVNVSDPVASLEETRQEMTGLLDEFVKDTHFRERKIALVEAFVKRAAMACIETVEAAYRLGRSKEIWTHHHSLVLSFV